MGDIYYEVGGNQNQQVNQSLTGNPSSDQYLNSLNPEDRQKIVDEGNQPLTGREAALALKEDPDLVLTKEEYQAYLQYHKTEETSILEGITEGGAAVLGDIAKAGGAFLDHPLEATAKLTPSLIEAFTQGTRNLYGMLSQSADPNSVLFKMKDAIAGNGSDAGYQQFLEARRFLKHSGQLASGEKTYVMDKDVIDHDITQAMSYIADPTLFIPFGTVASAGIRAAGMGEKLAALSMRASAIKSAVIGGGLKYAIGAPVELMGGAVRGTIDRAAAIGGGVLETATGMSAADLKGTLKLSGVATTGASIAGHGVPIVSDISNLYMAGGAARGIGEAIGAVGQQMMNQGLKRGNLSFAAQALIDTERAGVQLSAHAKGLLKVIDTFDPLLAYGTTMGEGMAHGALIGGGLGYLSGGEEGFGHGIGAGMALGGVGAGMGRIFADVTGGIRLARAEVQGHFNLITDKTLNPPRYEQFSRELANAKTPADRASVLQVYGGLDIIAPKAEWHMGNVGDFEAGLKAKGFDPEGYILDPSTGQRKLDAQGNPIKGHGIGSDVFRQIAGGVVVNKDGVVSIHINRDNASSSTIHHELFHAVLKTTMMKDGFLRDWSSALLGRFDANGLRVENGKVDPKEFKQFTDRYLDDIPANKNETPVQHKQRIADMKKNLADAHDSYIKNNGDLSKMTESHRNDLLYHTEEFGAYYFEKWLEGKPLDYLFHGGKIPGIRGLIGEATNALSDYWLRKGDKANPSFDFSLTKPDGTLMPLESGFQPAGKGSRVKNPAFDALLSDFVKAHSANQRSRSLALGEFTATGRLAYMHGQGLDGLHALFDPITGLKRSLTPEQITAENKEKGKAIAESLIKLPPADRTSITDGDGNITGSFSDKELVHLVKEGHISQPLADRLKSIQEAIADKTKPNVFGFLYHGLSQETAVVGSSKPRLTGDQVPVTRRRVAPVGHTISFGKDGFSVVMHGLDMNVIDARGNTLWSDPKVRALWGDNRADFDASFAEYISNASKAGNDTTRVPSEMLPSLAQLDGNGAARRDIMHQFLGLAKAEGVAFQNKPIAEIPRGTTSSMTSFRMDLMSPITVDHMVPRMNFDLGNAFKDLSTNFKVADMAKEDTPNGVVWTHESGYKLSKDEKTGKVQAYDSNGRHLGVFDNTKKAGQAAQKAYAKEQADLPARQERGAKIQQDFQNQFKVFHDADRAQAFERGDVFETDAVRALTDGTTIIRQTREEHYNERFLKLRQSDPETVLQVAEVVVAKGEAIAKQIAELQKYQETLPRNKEWMAVREQIVRLQSQDRTHDIRLAMSRAKSAFTDRVSQGQAILEYIKSSRKNGTRYDEMAKTFFGESYDSQFETGKPVSVVATHGTNSAELLASKEFNPEKFGIAGRHGSADDAVGAFFSGELKTSRGYGLDTNKSGIELQKEYGHEVVHRQVRSINRYDNPLVVDGNFQNYTPSRYRGYIEAARAGGHDGIIIQNIYDGGHADTVFVTMADKVKDNTMIIDTRLEVGVLRSDIDRKWSLNEHTEGAYGGEKQQSVPRGAMTMSDMGGSWKVSDKAGEKPLSNSEKQALKIVRTTLPMSMPDVWEMLKKSGNIVKNFNWREITGSVIVSNPDTMIAGSVSMGKTPILTEVKGGSNFPIAQQGEAWAVASKAKQTEYVNSLNAAYDAKVKEVKLLGESKGWSADKLKQELANVSVHMILTRGSDAKVLNNTQGAFGAMTLLKSFVKKGVLTEQGLRDALHKASQHTYVDKDTKQVVRTFPTLDYSGTENVSLNKLLNDKFFESEDTSTFGTRGTFVSEVIGEIAKNNKEFKSKENLAKLKEVFSNPDFKVTKESLLSEIGKSFSEPYTDNIPMHHAFASVSINGRVEGASSAHPAYPHGIRKVGGGQVTLNLFSDTVPIREMVNHTTMGDLSKTPLAENKLGSNSKGIARAVMKSSSEQSARPAGEGRIGANYKVSDIAGEPREGGRTYDTKSEQWKSGFLGRIAEENPDKVAGLEIKYSENTRLIKGKNLVTLTLHNSEGQQIGILNADVYGDGTAKIVDTQVAEQFGNRGYSKLMLSEFGERVRSQGVKEVTGEVVDKLDRPTKARKSVFGNAELDPDSISNISESGKVTVSKLDPNARYKPTSEDGHPSEGTAQKISYLKGLMERFERFKDAKGRENSDNKRRYWDATREYHQLTKYGSEPKVDTTPFQGNFKVAKAVHNSVSKVADVLTAEKDKSNLSPSIKNGFKAFSDAISKQDATDEVVVPEVRATYDALRKQVESELNDSTQNFTPKEVLKEIKTQLDKVDKHITKDAQKTAERIRNRDMAEGADIEGEQVIQDKATYRQNQNEGADLEAETNRQADLNEGAEQDSLEVPKPSMRTRPARPPVPFDMNTALLGSPANPVMPPSRLPTPFTPSGLPAPSGYPKPVAPVPPKPNPNATPATPTTQVPSGTPNRAWRGWTYDKSPNGSIYSNGIGWMIMVQGDKFKVYNPQKAMLGIYSDLDQAKRRVQREEPKR